MKQSLATTTAVMPGAPTHLLHAVVYGRVKPGQDGRVFVRFARAPQEE